MNRRRVLMVCAAGSLTVLLAWLAFAGDAATGSASGTGESAAPAPVAGDAPTSAELVEHPGKWDGQRIAFAGEAVGSGMVRGNHVWVHLNDDAYARASVEAGAPLAGYNSGQAVWVSASLAAGIATFGDYSHQGDLVRVEGVFNAACSQHGGDMDIHADVLTIERPGSVIRHPVKTVKVLWVIVLLPLVSGLWWIERRSSRRSPSVEERPSAS
jgi:hypothetical protein